MKKLIKWLESLTIDDFKESNITNSVYYIINGLKIRLADHFTPRNKDCDIQIIKPINNANIYTVVIKEGMQILGFTSLVKLKDFIETYSIINSIKLTSESIKSNESSKLEIKSNKDLIVNVKERTSPELWDKTADYLAFDCPRYKEFNSKQKKLCKLLLDTNKSYEDCVKLINTISKSNNFSTANMKKFLTPYLSIKLKDIA